MKQKMMRIGLYNGTVSLTPVFYELRTKSQEKTLIAEGDLDMVRTYSLEEINKQGWKLESITRIYDEKDISYQVAILTQVTQVTEKN